MAKKLSKDENRWIDEQLNIGRKTTPTQRLRFIDSIRKLVRDATKKAVKGAARR